MRFDVWLLFAVGYCFLGQMLHQLIEVWLFIVFVLWSYSIARIKSTLPQVSIFNCAGDIFNLLFKSFESKGKCDMRWTVGARLKPFIPLHVG